MILIPLVLLVRKALVQETCAWLVVDQYGRVQEETDNNDAPTTKKNDVPCQTKRTLPSNVPNSTSLGNNTIYKLFYGCSYCSCVQFRMFVCMYELLALLLRLHSSIMLGNVLRSIILIVPASFPIDNVASLQR